MDWVGACGVMKTLPIFLLDCQAVVYESVNQDRNRHPGQGREGGCWDLKALCQLEDTGVNYLNLKWNIPSVAES